MPSTHRTGSKLSTPLRVAGDDRKGIKSVGKEKSVLRQKDHGKVELPYGKRKGSPYPSKMTIADLDNENFRPSYLPTKINPILP